MTDSQMGRIARIALDLADNCKLLNVLVRSERANDVAVCQKLRVEVDKQAKCIVEIVQEGA